MKRLLYFAIFSLLVSHCKQEASDFNPPYDLSTLWEYHHQTEWDSLSTANHLLGKWKWNHTFCCGEGPQSESFTDDENLIIQFKEGGTLEVLEEGISRQESAWYLRIQDSDLYGIVADPPVTQLYGRILFTEQGVLFDDAYIDGGSNYFIRIE